MRDRGRGRGGLVHHRGWGGTVSEAVDHPIPTTPERTYAIRAHEDQDAPEVIDGIFSLYDIEIHVLIFLGSTHSYVCIGHVFDKIPAVEQLSYAMHVTSLLGHSISVNNVYINCPMLYKQESFSLI